MIVVVVRYDGRYGVMNADGIFKEYRPEEMEKVVQSFVVYAKEDIGKKKKRSTMYVQDLSTIGAAIHKSILKIGFMDMTERNGGNARKMISGGYCYLVGGDMGTWYGMTCVSPYGYENCIYSLDNVVGGVDNRRFLKSYHGGDVLKYLCTCYMKIIGQLTSYCGGTTPMTISAAAWKNWTERTCIYDRNDIYPDASKLDCDLYGITVDEYLRPSYHGGLCLCNAEQKMYENGITLDVNSLYPYICKECWLPVQKPYFWVGEMTDYMKDEIKRGFGMSFVHFSCKFDVKDGYLPFVQIPHDFMRRGVRRTSKVDNKAGVIDESVDMMMTNREYDLFLKHYDVRELKVYDGAFFHVVKGVFSGYVDEYFDLKRSAKLHGDVVMERVYKMMLNGLSGNFAKKRDRINLILDEEGTPISQVNGQVSSKSLIYIGSCITSWAKCMMVELAQQNVDRFLYMDTDSLHLLGQDIPHGIEVGDELGQMKIECKWKRAIFYGEKIYIEEDESGSWEMTYAGVPDEVQRHCEKLMNGFKNLQEYGFEASIETIENCLTDQDFKYTEEVANGTFTPDEVVQSWRVGISRRKDKARAAKDKVVRKKNRLNHDRTVMNKKKSPA